jgi:DnaJ homolog subfamily C member 8
VSCLSRQETWGYNIADVRLSVRSQRLVIHPDKCPHEQAPEAFNLLKKVNLMPFSNLLPGHISNFPSTFKAEGDLYDTPKREELDAAINEARSVLLKGLSLSTSTPDDHPKLRGLTPPFKVQLRQKSKEILIEEEVRRRRCACCFNCNMISSTERLITEPSR